MFPPGNIAMYENSSLISGRASEAARMFGLMLRLRRRALKMTQDQLALATGVGRRFLIDLESGKTTCQIGLSLVVADALGLHLSNMVKPEQPFGPSDLSELPPPLDDALEPEGEAVG